MPKILLLRKEILLLHMFYLSEVYESGEDSDTEELSDGENENPKGNVTFL